MVEITRDLLRTRAEHNEKMLSNLEEISLHQQNIKKIEHLEDCRHLKILYFQNNLIEKMEGLNKLQELEYLNLAVNSISKIEGTKRCESLNKLDLTLNFIDLEDLKESCENLEWNCLLTDMYLTGNPAKDWDGCRDYVIAKVETLMRLDGEEITKSDRLRAKTRLVKLEEELAQKAELNVARKIFEKKEGKCTENYTREMRWQDYCDEVDRKKREAEKQKEGSMFKEYHEMQEDMKRKKPGVYNKDGNPLQCNHGGYPWKFEESEDRTCWIFELQVPKFMDTASLNVDLQPQYVRAEIKDKVTQLSWPEEIMVERSKIQRSTTTGYLVITAPKSNIEEIEKKNMRVEKAKETLALRKKLDDLKLKQEEGVTVAKEVKREFLDVPDDGKKKVGTSREAFVADFDEDEVPPLE